MSAELFLQASKAKPPIRFQSVKGELMVEQLWTIDLQSKNGFDLDTIAKSVNAELKTQTEESFVSTKANPARNTLQLKLDIIKFIIAERIAENEAKSRRAAALAERAKLIDILGDQQDAALRCMSPEELKQRVEAIERSL